MKTLEIYYGNSSIEQKRFIEERISRLIVTNQTYLVEKLFEKDIASYDDITNFLEDEGGNYPEIFDWWLINNDYDYLARKLIGNGECVLESDYGTWWGRKCCGQAIAVDNIFWNIFQNEIKEIK